MNRRALAILLAAAIPARSYAMGIVFDPRAVAQDIQMVQHLQYTVQELRMQYQTLVSTYHSLTGGTNITGLLNNPMLGQMLPGNWEGVYSGVQSGTFSGITGSLEGALNDNQLTGSYDNQAMQLQQEQQSVPFDNEALSMNAYSMEQDRLNQLQQQAYQAGQQQDMKQAIDVGNEIKAQQNIIQAENEKIQLMGMLEQNQQRIIQAQQQQLSGQILNPANSQYAAVPAY